MTQLRAAEYQNETSRLPLRSQNRKKNELHVNAREKGIYIIPSGLDYTKSHNLILSQQWDAHDLVGGR
jgi:hypothetical protein